VARRDREQAPLMMQRTGSGLSPWSSFDAEALDAVKMGAPVEVTIRQPRSRSQHRLYWMAASRIAENVEGYPSAEHLHDATKVHLGYVQRIRRIDGTVMFIPDSTAFAAMDQAEFKVFFDRAVKLWAETFGFDPLAAIEERVA